VLVLVSISVLALDFMSMLVLIFLVSM